MIVIVNYGIGNLDSVSRALRRTESDVQVSADPKVVECADGIVLPGVGSFDEAMRNLERSGLIPVLNRRTIELGIPTLGICLGFQMFSKSSEEGEIPGLGWLDAETRKFRFPDGAGGLKIPQLGWNDLNRRGDNPLFEGVPEDASFYFAHSYYVDCHEQDAVAATTEYGIEYVSSVRRGNLFGVQFHPEKSHANGLAVVANFVKCCSHA